MTTDYDALIESTLNPLRDCDCQVKRENRGRTIHIRLCERHRKNHVWIECTEQHYPPPDGWRDMV